MPPERLLLISGPIHAGKTTLAKELQRAFGFVKVSSSQYLKTLLPADVDGGSERARELMQETGDRLDIETDYRWIVDPVASSQINAAPEVKNWLIDAVRKPRQVQHFRSEFPNVKHAHLTAPEAVLRSRHQDTPEHYARTVAHPNEVHARSLATMADLVLDSTMHSSSALVERVINLWGS